MRDSLDPTRCTKFLKAVADPERLRIIGCLQGGPLSVGEIAERLKAPVANVSHHLKQLKIGEVVTATKRGKQVIYALDPEVLKRPKGKGGALDVLDFGCCRLELGESK